MDNAKLRLVRRDRRKRGKAKYVLGTPERPRLCIYRSLRHIYAQIIDDLTGRTLVSAGSKDKDYAADGPSGNAASAGEVGKLLATRAIDAGIKKVCFDRNGFRYHGRVKALADEARKAGLDF
ncbi:MAG: 50S ribosomal protein L18 [Planctomycetes bacterium]|nr:50S ribosomal protein L18 [Planctomycetota bacterium]NOG54816.1 50S ribosomal protein L18 [Planctomycetota bacterium]